MLSFRFRSARIALLGRAKEDSGNYLRLEEDVHALITLFRIPTTDSSKSGIHAKTART